VTDTEAAFAGSGPQSLKWNDKISRHGHFCHDVPENLRWLPHGPDDVRNEAKPQAEEQPADEPYPASGGFPENPASFGLFKDDHGGSLRHCIHLKIALRRDTKRIGYTIKECKHGGNIHSFGDLRLSPSMIAESLDILFRGAICGFCHLCYVVEESPFSCAQ